MSRQGCVVCRCENGERWVEDHWDGGRWEQCACECHGVFCPICERMHQPGKPCRLKMSKVAREYAAQRFSPRGRQ